MIVRNWMDSPSRVTHGYIIERVIFTKEDPEEEGKEGAVMLYIDSLSRAYLESLCESVPTTHDDIQEIFFVVSGKGVFKAGNEERSIREGDGIVVPAGVTHSLKNELCEPLEFIIVVVSTPEGAEAKKEVLIRNYRETPLGRGHWNHLVHPVFGTNDRLEKIHTVLVVGMEPMQTADTHGHEPGTGDEIWYMLKGSGLHVVNQEVCRQRPGDAVQVVPSTGHSLINDTDKPLQLLYVRAPLELRALKKSLGLI